MLKLSKKLSNKQFILFVSSILIGGLIFIGGFYFILNAENFKPKDGFSLGPITSAPKTLRIDLEQPEEDALLFESDLIVSGQTGPNMEVLIMSDASDFVVKSDSSGRFSKVIKLDEGTNKITALVFDSEGDSRFAERNVYFSKEKL